MINTISPIDKSVLLKELNNDYFVRKTNYGDNEIYVITAHSSPNVMQEIGRLRELTFRAAGGGTGKDCDIDKYDVSENPYGQLVVWNPIDKEIVGGYRFMHGKFAQKDENGSYQFGTSGLFKISEKFEKEYLPHTIELGRSFVQPLYQPSKDSRKGFYSLDNIWDGLGALTVDNPDVKYFFGKVTMYPQYNVKARNMILFFMDKYFKDKDALLVPYEPIGSYSEDPYFQDIFTGTSYDENYRILNSYIRDLNTNIPPLVNAYMNLSDTMKVFGTAINKTFGVVEETGILVTIDDIHQAKKERHLSSYQATGKARNFNK